MRRRRITRKAGRGSTVTRHHALRGRSHTERSCRGARRLTRHGKQTSPRNSHSAPYHPLADGERNRGGPNMTHPSSLDLEAFACEGPASHGPGAKVAEHLAVCDACAAFVQRLGGLVATGPTAADADALIARALASVPAAAKVTSIKDAPAREGGGTNGTKTRGRWWLVTTSVITPLAAAAAVLLLAR